VLEASNVQDLSDKSTAFYHKTELRWSTLTGTLVLFPSLHSLQTQLKTGFQEHTLAIASVVPITPQPSNTT